MPENSVPTNAVFGRLIPNFTDKAAEAEFRSARAAAEIRDTRATIGLLIGVNSSFAGLDVLLFEHDLTLLLILRLVLANGVLFAALALSFNTWVAQRISLTTITVTLLYVVFYAIFCSIADAPPIFVAGIVMLFFGIYVVTPLRYAHAVVLGWSAMALYLALVIGLDIISLNLFAVLAGELVAANAIGMFTLYRLEHLRRLDFHNLNRVAAERSRYHDLLVRILPASIAERMRGGEQHIADQFEEASVLFVDIVGFTRLSAKFKPEEVLTLLERVFAAFDELVNKHGLEKIKTIGDAYLVAAGLPEPRADHAEAVADFALDLQRMAHSLRSPDGSTIEIRIDLHSGPLIAGVIGESRFLYDMWGDTVNVASRMESLGMPGKIQVSEEAHNILAEKFTFDPRGKIDVKGRSEMHTWWLSGRR